MSKGIYSSLSGALAQQRRVESISNNMANVNTVGYKRDDISFKEHLTLLSDPSKETPVPEQEFKPGDFYHLHGADKSFAVTDAQYTDFSQGPLKATGRDLDVALQGKGFFEIGTPQGVRFTRNGVLNLAADGTLVNSDGFPVLSKPPAASPESLADVESRVIRLGPGQIHIAENGDVFQKGRFLVSLQVTEFADPSKLVKEGHHLLRNDDPANLVLAEATSKTLQRHVEGANVNPVQEMTTLLDAQRSFEHNLKAIQHFDTITGRAVNDIAKF